MRYSPNKETTMCYENEQRRLRARKVLKFYQNSVRGEPWDEAETPSFAIDIFTDMMHLLSTDIACEAFRVAAVHYAAESEAAPLVSQEEYKAGSMRTCPKCGADAQEANPTEENAPITMHCPTCNSLWDIIWKHDGFEFRFDGGE